MVALKEEREHLKESWANGEFSAAFDTEMAVKNAGATGYCSACNDVLNFDKDRVAEVLRDAE